MRSSQGMSAGELLRQANQLKRSGKLEEAIALYHQVIDINPHFAWAYHGLGDAWAKQGNLDEAVAWYSECLKIHPDSAWLYYSFGEALAQLGDLEAAVKYLQKAVEVKPDFHKFRTSLKQVEAQFIQKKYNQFTVNKYLAPLTVVELGQGWAGNTINTVIFRHHGIITSTNYQFSAYYDSNKTLRVVKRNLDNGLITYHRISGEYNLQDAHNSISLGVDSEGYIHICYDHHVHSLRYRRSQQPWSIDEWTDVLSMTGNNEENVTYPTFLSDPVDNSLIFLYRDGHSSKGQACLKKYDVATKLWEDYPFPILSGYEQKPWTSNPYWNHPVFDATGKLHLSYVWRTHPIGRDKRVNNIGIDYAYSPDQGRAWFTIKGLTLDLPITQVNSETVWAVPTGSNLINQTSMATNSKGYPHIVFYANDENDIPQYQHLWFDGCQWQHSVISKRTQKFDLLGGGTLQIPMSRPEIVIDKQDCVHVIYRSDLTEHKMAVLTLFPEDYHFSEAVEKILWNEPLGFAEPIIDRLRWQKDATLSMLIQYNHQPQHDQGVSFAESPVYIMDWCLNIS
ncbi:BNR-4 repeat-containing protein [Limnospira sp. PMC 1295.21]|uniref:BNR repeat-containing protein n=1 Tax=Limnospira sp. PMC 1295.21 TaxID=2981078 RepID=UPI0028E4123A|nr:BNR-4 repeat-containing protein [Limnospira sp. PMC 1295.21]